MNIETYEYTGIIFEWTVTRGGKTFCYRVTEKGIKDQGIVYKVKTDKQLKAILAFLNRNMPGGVVRCRKLSDIGSKPQTIASRYPQG